MNFNKAFLGGHLTHDPEVQFTTAGTAMCNFQIAVNDNYTNKDGELVENVDFFRFTAFGNQAEFIGEFFHKGKAIFIECRAKRDEWTDKTSGEIKNDVSFKVIKAEFVGRKEDDPRTDVPGAPPAPTAAAAPAVEEDDIPF